MSRLLFLDSKQARSHSAAEQRLARDVGVWRLTTYNMYKNWSADNNIPPFPITAPIFALWLFDLGRPTSSPCAANNVSHIEQIRLAIEEARIWCSVPEEKLGKDLAVKAIKIGFRGDGEPAAFKFQRSTSSSPSEGSNVQISPF